MVTDIQEQSANLNILTEKITKCFESSAPSTSEMNQPEDVLFLSILATLARIPEEKRLSCIVEVLQVIQKYILGISEKMKLRKGYYVFHMRK